MLVRPSEGRVEDLAQPSGGHARPRNSLRSGQRSPTPTLEHLFASVKDHMTFLAENGTMVIHQGAVIKVHPLDQDFANRLVRRIRQMIEDSRDLNALVCGRKSGYIEETDPAFVWKANAHECVRGP